MAKLLHPLRALLAATVFTLFISGCSTTPDDDVQRDTAALIEFAQQAERDGKYGAAGNAYKQLALIAAPEARTDFQIKAIAMMVEGNYIEQAQRTLHAMPTEGLSVIQQQDLNLIVSRLALAESNPAYALELLQDPPSPLATTAQHAQYYQLRAQAFSRAGNLIEAVREYIKRGYYLNIPLEPFAEGPSEIEENQLLIWQSLMMLSDAMLQQLRIDPPPDPLSGWLELAHLAKRSQLNNTRLEDSAATPSLTTWRERYPNLQVSENILASVEALRSEDVVHPKKIALLLPMSGNFAKVADIIRDGFLAAHLSNNSAEPRPTIQLYDTSSSTETVSNLYRKAVANGAEFIVGPLGKAEVDTLLQKNEIIVPTLTLNYSNDLTLMANNLFQFGLSPEDEARQLAERAWLDGYNQALTIVPEGEWAARILQAFNERWEALSGTIAEQQTYASSKNDFSGPLRNLLNIDESEQRRRTLSQLLGTELKFEPRRRQDAGFIFMVAFPRQARLIKPQLKFHYAGDLPVYATSHLYSGTADKEANRDLDEITFCDIPWVLKNTHEASDLSTRIQQLWPDENRQYTRFYAMGIDAYNLIPQIKHMATFRYQRHHGETGALSLNASNHIVRQLPWARFKGGLARPL